MSKIRLLLLTHEMNPFLQVSELADFLGTLPQSLQEKGFEIRILMPRFGCINERRNRLHEVIRLSGLNIVVNDNDNPLIIKVASLPSARLQVYFLDNEDYFQRKFVFRNADGKFYDDNDERAVFYAKGALETIKKLGWSPDIIHCHDWMTALVPMYIKHTYQGEPIFKNSKVVYSVYKKSFEESLGANMAQKAAASGVLPNHLDAIENDQTCNGFHKMGIQFADAVVKHDEALDADVEDFITKSGNPSFAYKHGVDDMGIFSSIYEEMASEVIVG